MIVGIGTDIIEIERVESAIKSNEKFLKKIFTIEEQKMFTEKYMRNEVIAGNFSAKESISKALGTGIRGFSLKDIEILRDDLGKPVVKLYGNCKELADKLGVTDIHITISHNRSMAISYAVMERKDN
ncbi:holo-ACP synthase [Inconstantimicrobium mannanitabidum]|uniref:Holo-[acyl-carrier-protein] synthase n=1 Tax=Inconstantimicrobium mannanitabidum TaxID=1604901 RepID=A0ACB5RG28_9CLOT|nr:holo-ACP synthase [Clostridium sp. TW13]GKX68053.1 holo-[acyl-carrier-protein] synthase [Clostridium sp. TW13]